MSEEQLKARLALARIRAEVSKIKFGSLFNRWPAGSSKGGQFAPKGNTSMGGGHSNTFQEVGGPGWGHYEKPKGPPPGSKPHPAGVNDKGQPVTINYPTKASGKETWANKNATATFVPGGDAPKVLNGVEMKSWAPPKQGWSSVGGNNEKLEALFPFERPASGKSTGAGVLIVEPDGRVWLTKPTNEFGGYKQTYPKGTVESGLTMQQNAIKEAWEETGLKIQITGVLGDYDRTTSRARMYLARRVGGTPRDMGWETQAVRLASFKDAKQLLNMSHDKAILDDLEAYLNIGKAKGGAGGKGGHWQQQARWPAGSPLGGQWKATGRDGITLPPTIAGGLDGANPAYQKAVNAVHASAQKGDVKPAIDLAAKYGAKLDAFMAGTKGNSHQKWGGGAAQYAHQIINDLATTIKASSTAVRLSGPPKASSIGTYVGDKQAMKGGSNPGDILKAPDGATWMVKGNKQFVNGNVTPQQSDDRAKNEVLASKLMLAAGVGAPEMKVVDLEGKHGGGLGVAGKMIDGATKLDVKDAAHKEMARADFAVHAWLANYDVLGQGADNTVFKDGKAINIDPGGALLFRAQGLPKETKNGVLDPTAPEFESMRKSSHEQIAVYGGMTQEHLTQSAKKLQTISDDTIRDLVKTYGPGDDAFKDKLAQNLIDRKNAILDKAGLPFKIGMGTSVASPEKADAPDAVASNHLAAAMKLVNTSNTAVKNALAKGVEFPGPQYTATAALNGNKDPQLVDLAVSAVSAKMNGDVSALAMVQIKAKEMAGSATSANYKAGNALAKYALAAMQEAQAAAIKSAAPIAAAAPKVSMPPKPTFPGKKFGNSYYRELASYAEKHFKDGDLAALKALAVKPGGGNAWPKETANGKVMEAWHKALVQELELQGAAVTVARVKQAHAAVTTPAKPQPNPSAAMPDILGAKISTTNTNAKSHNAKLDAIHALVQKGDVNGLLSLNFGSNNYAAKEVKLTNAALTSLGSAHVVTTSQKANSHPALFGGVTAAEATAAAAKVNTTLPPASTAAKDVANAIKGAKSENKDWLKLRPGEKIIEQGEEFGVKFAHIETPAKGFTPSDIPAAPDFFKNGSQGDTGTWKSSKKEVNEANNTAVQLIYNTAVSGAGARAVADLKFDVIDKNTGIPTGQKISIDKHPAANVKEYHNQVVSELKAQLKPGSKTLQSGSFTGAYADVSKALAANHKKVDYKNFSGMQRAADYVVVSKDGAASIPLPKEGAFKELKPSSPTLKTYAAASKAGYEKMTSAEQSAAKAYTGSSYDAWNDALRKGAVGTSSFDSAQTMVKAFQKGAVDLPEGTVIWRGIGVGKATYESVVGGIIQDGSFNSASYGSRPAFSSYSTWLKIHVAGPGVKAIDATNFSKFGSHEREIIIQNGVRYAVLKVTQHDKFTDSDGVVHYNKTIVDLLALPHEP